VGDRNTNKEKADWQVQTEKHRDKEVKSERMTKRKRRAMDRYQRNR